MAKSIIQDRVDQAVAQGQHIVMASHDDTRSFAYTIGLTSQGLPELIVFGLPQQYAAYFLNEVATTMKEKGAPVDGAVNGELGNLPMAFKIAQPGRAEEFAFQAVYYYDEKPVKPHFMQMVISDKTGKLPWEPDYDLDYMAKPQPHLWESA